MLHHDWQSLARIGASDTVATGYRNQSPEFDPTSGEGSLIHGGRFNPPDSFPVLYLCTSSACARAEFRRQADRQSITIEGLLPRELWEIQVTTQLILNLTNTQCLTILSISPADLVGDDRSLTHEIGAAAHHYGFQSIVAPSATGVDNIMAVLLDNVKASSLRSHLLDTWRSVEDV